jgi:acyl-ACP thioesterase
VQEGELKYSLQVAYSDYDHNQHVNNAKYADYCMNCFSVSELQRLWVKGFAISYLRQCKEGENLRFYRKKQTENEYFVQGINEKDEIVVQMRLTFAMENSLENTTKTTILEQENA